MIEGKANIYNVLRNIGFISREHRSDPAQIHAGSDHKANLSEGIIGVLWTLNLLTCINSIRREECYEM